MSLNESEPAVEHVVLLKVKAEATEDDIEKLMNGAKSLHAIPGVLTVSVGKVFVEDFMEDRTQGHNYVLAVRLSSKDALKSYKDHPDHLKVIKECLAPILSAPPLAVDWVSPQIFGKK
uniref:Stress-response A/B barrel domain-containing protein n=1 Tax=Odontella aurita TaxID=265563 RepID=A0A7S4K471_9STRA|mmetsp:Transcript_61296/g.181268  ORF Transcript_61296/g.181268 Transcript_61296/m.181268 type:complete len:118 (+) Transcript_61296:170-523(+)|eukprot:CAMPEP_0113575496 /NCGR_PEP_ID=MMETSP0015_2-20120614/27732_1 /TAXON_ID=2838 /ORGANISM="Odontella" /LENGTH=117 /DNA_ID=CAMNT_0000478745 /DNA_START=119 /DNA_END=472 /DNA_ORIENTATION=- /assembly_acc=CAM_ASM_000160